MLDKSSPLLYATKPHLPKPSLAPIARPSGSSQYMTSISQPSIPRSTKYDDLKVTQDLRDIFQYITSFTPATIDIDSTIKPFIPDYEPAIGEVDACLKVPRPDGKPDVLGLSRIDEPSVTESDPALVTMQLKALSKTHGTPPDETIVRSIERAEDNPDEITKWISSVEKLHSQLPLPRVQYSRR